MAPLSSPPPTLIPHPANRNHHSQDQSCPSTSRSNSPARPINPPEEWYAPGSDGDASPARNGAGHEISDGGSATMRASEQSNGDAVQREQERLGEEVGGGGGGVGGDGEEQARSQVVDADAVAAVGKGDHEEAYWRRGASALGPGEGWYALSSREPGGRVRDVGEGEGGVGDESEKRNGVFRSGVGGGWSRGVGQYRVDAGDDEGDVEDDKGGSGELGPGESWYASGS